MNTTIPHAYNPFSSPSPMWERNQRIAESLTHVLLRSHPRATLCGLSVETFYEAAMEEAGVGGDSYDVFPLFGSRVALTVADASGKGLAAAERVAEVRFALRAFLREHDDPRHALSCLNDFVCAAQLLGKRDEGTFVTLSLVILDSTTGNLTCLCAGGEPPLVLRSRGTARVVPIRGVALGLFPGLYYEATTSRLEPGDTLLLATDGLTEARHYYSGNPHEPGCSSFLGLAGLARLARRTKQMSLYERGRWIFEGARAFAGGAFHDDACLLMARSEAVDTGRTPPANAVERKGDFL